MAEQGTTQAPSTTPPPVPSGTVEPVGNPPEGSAMSTDNLPGLQAPASQSSSEAPSSSSSVGQLPLPPQQPTTTLAASGPSSGQLPSTLPPSSPRLAQATKVPMATTVSNSSTGHITAGTVSLQPPGQQPVARPPSRTSFPSNGPPSHPPPSYADNMSRPIVEKMPHPMDSEMAHLPPKSPHLPQQAMVHPHSNMGHSGMHRIPPSHVDPMRGPPTGGIPYTKIPPTQPPPVVPPPSAPGALIYDYADKIKDEFQMVEMRLDALLRERNELNIQYSKHWEMAYQLNAEVHKQLDINSRYQAIINQLLPMLTMNVQTGVRQDMESIKNIAESVLPNPPPVPPIVLDHGVYRDGANSPPPMNGMMSDMDMKRPRGRPSKARLEKLKEVNKRMRMDPHEMEGPPFRSMGPPEGMQHGMNPHAAPPGYPSHPPVQQAPQPRPTTGVIPEAGISKGAVPRGANLAAVLPHGEVVCALALSHPFQHVFTGGRGIVKIWDVSGMRETRKGVNVGTLECLDNYIRACHITRDSKTMIVAGEARYMVVCDIGSSNPSIIGRLQTPNQLTYALSASKDSRTAFSCCSDGSVNMWDLRSMSLVKSFEGHEDSVTCCCLTPDGQKLITGSLDKTVRVWDIAEGREHCKYNFPAQIFSLGVCPMEPIIAVGLETSVVDVRFLSNFDLNQELHLHDSCVLGLKYAPSGSWFMTSGKDHKWIGWKSMTCETLFQQMENASILSCDISRDGRFVVTGSGESLAHVYELVY